MWGSPLSPGLVLGLDLEDRKYTLGFSQCSRIFLPIVCKASHGGVCGKTGDSEIQETARGLQQEWT